MSQLIDAAVEKEREKESFYMVLIDFECSGRNILYNDMLCFGVTIRGYDTGKVWTSRSFYVKPVTGMIRWEDRCLREHWNQPGMENVMRLILSNVEKNGRDVKDIMKEFYEFVQCQGINDRAVLMYDTNGMDGSWMDYYMCLAGLDPLTFLFGEWRPIIDSHSYNLGIAKRLPSKGLWDADKAALEALGDAGASMLAKNEHPNDHSPENDALHISWNQMAIADLIKKQQQQL